MPHNDRDLWCLELLSKPLPLMILMASSPAAPSKASLDPFAVVFELHDLSSSLSANPVQISIASLCMSAALLLAIALDVYKNRPRGWAREDLVHVATSKVAGQGLYATRDIPKNTVLGAYPGIPRNACDMAVKAQRCPQVEQYVFTTDSGFYLDPTDASGRAPSPYPGPGLVWPFPTPIPLAVANEPTEGSSGPNCSVENGNEDDKELLFVTSRDIMVGEEIWIDYGRYYNRSGYGMPGF